VERSDVADKDEEAQAEGSSAAEPSDAADKPAETEVPESVGDEPTAPEDAPDFEFEAIVRNSGVDPVEPTPEESPAQNDPTQNGNGTNKVLEPAGVGATVAGGTGRAARERRAAPTPKGTATAKRNQPVKPERTTPVKFVRQSVGELRKVVYPTGQQLINYFVVVLVFVLFVIAYVSLLDLGLGAAILKIFS
jgi:preprotein translocase subunit SecE